MGPIIGPNSIISKYVKSCTGSKEESEVADFQNSFSPICENTKKPATLDSSPDPHFLFDKFTFQIYELSRDEIKRDEENWMKGT